MAVTYVFSPSTTILSGQVNTNNTDITSGKALNGFTFDVKWNNDIKIIFKDTVGADDAYIRQDGLDNLVIASPSNEVQLLGNTNVATVSGSGMHQIFKTGFFTPLQAGFDGANGLIEATAGTVIITAAASYIRTGAGKDLYVFANDNVNAAYVSQSGGNFGAFGSLAGDVYLGPSADGQVVIIGRMPRRAQSTSTYVNTFIQRGWGYIIGNNTLLMSAAVTFPVAFNNSDVDVVANHIGTRPTSAGTPNSAAWFTVAATAAAQTNSVTTTGFNLELTTPFNSSVADYYGYSWVAMGNI